MIGKIKRNPAEFFVPFVRAYLAVLFVEIEMLYSPTGSHVKVLGHVSPEHEPRIVRQRIQALTGAHESCKAILQDDKHSLLHDITAIIQRYQMLEQKITDGRSYEASLASLEESKLGIQQNTTVKRLTQLAFVFIPLSFVTSVFGMNIDLLSGDGAKWWTTIIGAVLIYYVVGLALVNISINVQDQEWIQWVLFLGRRYSRPKMSLPRRLLLRLLKCVSWGRFALIF